MGFNSSSGIPQPLTATGTFTTTQAKLTSTIVSGAVANNATITLGTVPASKKWTVVSVSISSSGGGAGGLQYGSVQLNGVKILQTVHEGSATTLGGVHDNSLNFDYQVAPVLATGQTITCVSSGANTNVVATAVYIEESA